MVGIVIVSHSDRLAEGVIDLTEMMASGIPIAAAGGLEDGSYGTSYARIKDAIDRVYSDDGVLVLMDMGSAVMTTRMVIDMEEEGRRIEMADCPIVEGAVAASVDAKLGLSLDAILANLAETARASKF